MERVCIFIDGSNFYHAVKAANCPTNIDFRLLTLELTGAGRKHVHTFYYNTPLVRPHRDDPNFTALEKACKDQQRFFNALRFVPNLTVRFGRFQKLPDGTQVEKGVDVMLAIDMLTLAFRDQYDVAILVSSDADYKHAVEAVKHETAKAVQLHQVDGSKAYDLITVCTEYKPIRRETLLKCVRPPRDAR